MRKTLVYVATFGLSTSAFLGTTTLIIDSMFPEPHPTLPEAAEPAASDEVAMTAPDAGDKAGPGER